MVAKLTDPERAKLEPVLKELRDPGTCWAKYLSQPDAEQGPIGEDDLDMGEESTACAVPQSAIGAVKEGFNKAIGMLLDLVLDLMSGKFFPDCRMIASYDPGQGLLKAMLQAQSADEHDDVSNCSLVQQLKIIVEKFENSSKSVDAVSTAPAPSLFAALTADAAASSDEVAERERQWKHVQGERRKYITFSVPRTLGKDAILQSFRACGKVFAHKGNLNSSHRLICASADLLSENAPEPWSTQTKPNASDWQEISAFAISLSGPEDFLVLCDGRMRDIRRLSEP